MNADTLHKLQVAAFWGIFIQLLILNILLIVAFVELAPYLPELLDVLEEIGRSL